MNKINQMGQAKSSANNNSKTSSNVDPVQQTANSRTSSYQPYKKIQKIEQKVESNMSTEYYNDDEEIKAVKEKVKEEKEQ